MKTTQKKDWLAGECLEVWFNTANNLTKHISALLNLKKEKKKKKKEAFVFKVKTMSQMPNSILLTSEEIKCVKKSSVKHILHIWRIL